MTKPAPRTTTEARIANLVAQITGRADALRGKPNPWHDPADIDIKVRVTSGGRVGYEARIAGTEAIGESVEEVLEALNIDLTALQTEAPR